MFAPVSDVLDRTAAEADSTSEPVSYFWFKMPDLNERTNRALGESGAGWTFNTICRLVHHVGRVGRPQARKAAKELGRLGVGLKAIADQSGQSPNKVRRDLVKLVDLGLVAVTRRNVTFGTDPATGRIRENRTGRSLPVLVFVTIGPEHLRQKAGKVGNPPKLAPATPATVAPLPAPDRVHPGTRIQRERITERTPDGDAVGIGSPPASRGGGLPAGQEGGQEAAEAGRLPAAVHEGDQVARANLEPPEADLPPTVGRISRPAAAPAKPARGDRGGYRPRPDEPREPHLWSGPAEAARLKMIREQEERRRADEQHLRDEAARGTLTIRQRALSGGCLPPR
jgi:hypothetical protein